MHHLLKALVQVAAHALCGRVRVEILRICFLQVLQLTHQFVILLVRDHRVVEHIILRVVAVKLLAKPIYSLFD